MIFTKPCYLFGLIILEPFIATHLEGTPMHPYLAIEETTNMMMLGHEAHLRDLLQNYSPVAGL